MRTRTQRSTPNFLLLILCASALSAGCDSRIVEENPEATEVTGLKLENRLSLRRSLENRLSQLNNGLAGVVKVSKQIEELLLKKKSSGGAYTVLDSLIELNDSLKAALPASSEANRITRRKTIQLPEWSLKTECQQIEVEADFIVSSDLNISSATYSMKTCETQDQFVAIAWAIFDGNQLQFGSDAENLNRAFSDPIADRLLGQFDCQARSEKSTLLSLECKNIDIPVSEKVRVLITESKYSKADVVRFRTLADIFENEVIKAKASLLIDNEGHIDFQIINQTKMNPSDAS
jgi:hypothetical protein